MPARISTRKGAIFSPYLKKSAEILKSAADSYFTEVTPVTYGTIKGVKDNVTKFAATNNPANLTNTLRQLKNQVNVRSINAWFLSSEDEFDTDGAADADLSFDIPTDDDDTSAKIAATQISAEEKNANKISKTFVETTHKLMESQLNSTANIMSGIDRIGATLTTGFDSINATLNKLLEVTTKNTSALITMTAAGSNNSSSSGPKPIGANGKFDPKEYFKMVTENASSSSAGLTLGMVGSLLGSGSLKEMFGPNEVIGGLLKMGLDKAKPNLKKNLAELDSVINDVIVSSLTRLGNKPNSAIGKLFGINTDKKELDTSRGQVELKAVPYDGISKEALTNAIPGYLRKILVQLGGPDVVYDYRSRTFKSMGGMKKEFQRSTAQTETFGSSSSSLKKAMGGKYNNTDFRDMTWDLMLEELASMSDSNARQKIASFKKGGGKDFINGLFTGLPNSSGMKKANSTDLNNFVKDLEQMNGILEHQLINMVNMVKSNSSRAAQQNIQEYKDYNADTTGFKDTHKGRKSTIYESYTGKGGAQARQPKGFAMGGLDYTNMALYEIHKRLSTGINVFQVGGGNFRADPFKATKITPPATHKPKDTSFEKIGNVAISGDSKGNPRDGSSPFSGGSGGEEGGIKAAGKNLLSALFSGNASDVRNAMNGLLGEVGSVVSDKAKGFLSKKNQEYGNISGYLKHKLTGAEYSYTDNDGKEVKVAKNEKGGMLSYFDKMLFGKDGAKGLMKGMKNKAGNWFKSVMGYFNYDSKDKDEKGDVQKKRRNLIATSVGAMAGMGLLGGPLGLIMGALAGNAIGQSEGIGSKIKKLLFGEEDKEKGKKKLGLIQKAANKIVDPIRFQISKTMTAFGSVLKKNILGPLSNIGAAIKERMSNAAGGVVSKVFGKLFNGSLGILKKLILLPFKAITAPATLLGKGARGAAEAGGAVVGGGLNSIAKVLAGKNGKAAIEERIKQQHVDAAMDRAKSGLYGEFETDEEGNIKTDPKTGKPIKKKGGKSAYKFFKGKLDEERATLKVDDYLKETYSNSDDKKEHDNKVLEALETGLYYLSGGKAGKKSKKHAGKQKEAENNKDRNDDQQAEISSKSNSLPEMMISKTGLAMIKSTNSKTGWMFAESGKSASEAQVAGAKVADADKHSDLFSSLVGAGAGMLSGDNEITSEEESIIGGLVDNAAKDKPNKTTIVGKFKDLLGRVKKKKEGADGGEKKESIFSKILGWLGNIGKFFLNGGWKLALGVVGAGLLAKVFGDDFGETIKNVWDSLKKVGTGLGTFVDWLTGNKGRDKDADPQTAGLNAATSALDMHVDNTLDYLNPVATIDHVYTDAAGNSVTNVSATNARNQLWMENFKRSNVNSMLDYHYEKTGKDGARLTEFGASDWQKARAKNNSYQRKMNKADAKLADLRDSFDTLMVEPDTMTAKSGLEMVRDDSKKTGWKYKESNRQVSEAEIAKAKARPENQAVATPTPTEKQLKQEAKLNKKAEKAQQKYLEQGKKMKEMRPNGPTVLDEHANVRGAASGVASAAVGMVAGKGAGMAAGFVSEKLGLSEEATDMVSRTTEAAVSAGTTIAAGMGKGICGKAKDLLMTLIDKLLTLCKNNEAFKGIIGQVDDVLGSVKSKITETALRPLEKLLVKILGQESAKTAMGAATAGIGFAVTAVAGGIGGFCGTEQLFGVLPGQADGWMKSISSILGAIFGAVPYIGLVEILDIFIKPLTGKGVRQWLAELLYTFGGLNEEATATLKEKQGKLSESMNAYNEKYGTDLDASTYNDMINKGAGAKIFGLGGAKLDENGNPMFDEAGELLRTNHGMVGWFSSGEKQYAKDADGNIIRDANGKAVQAIDANGHKIYKEGEKKWTSHVGDFFHDVGGFFAGKKKYKTDENGNVMYDENGQPIVESKEKNIFGRTWDMTKNVAGKVGDLGKFVGEVMKGQMKFIKTGERSELNLSEDDPMLGFKKGIQTATNIVAMPIAMIAKIGRKVVGFLKDKVITPISRGMSDGNEYVDAVTRGEYTIFSGQYWANSGNGADGSPLGAFPTIISYTNRVLKAIPAMLGYVGTKVKNGFKYMVQQGAIGIEDANEDIAKVKAGEMTIFNGDYWTSDRDDTDNPIGKLSGVFGFITRALQAGPAMLGYVGSKIKKAFDYMAAQGAIGMEDASEDIAKVKRGEMSVFNKDYWTSDRDDTDNPIGKLSGVFGFITRLMNVPSAMMGYIGTKAREGFAKLTNGVDKVIAQSDATIKRAEDGSISIFSGEFWKAPDVPEDSPLGKLAVVGTYFTKIAHLPGLLIKSAFQGLKDLGGSIWNKFTELFNWANENGGVQVEVTPSEGTGESTGGPDPRITRSPIAGGYSITSGFSGRTINGISEQHTGIDMIPANGSNQANITAIGNAKVVGIQRGISNGTSSLNVHGNASMGNYVNYQLPDGTIIKNMHMSEGSIPSTLKVGDNIRNGQVIGHMGSTGRSNGNHLHFQVENKYGIVDPRAYLSGKYGIGGPDDTSEDAETDTSGETADGTSSPELEATVENTNDGATASQQQLTPMQQAWQLVKDAGSKIAGKFSEMFGLNVSTSSGSNGAAVSGSPGSSGGSSVISGAGADRVISVAKGEVGYLEKNGNSNLDDKTANAGSGNYTKYWRDIDASYQGQPWCAAFVTWCFTKAFGKENAKKLLKHYPFVYCPTLGSLFTLNNTPKRGDIVLFYRSGRFAHTGLVVAVNGQNFTTIEGNTSGGSSVVANGEGVHEKNYSLGDPKLAGVKFCTPEYSSVSSSGSEGIGGPEEQAKIAESAKTFKGGARSYGGSNSSNPGYCTAWVEHVYEDQLGKGVDKAADANVAYDRYGKSTDMSKAPLGSAIYAKYGGHGHATIYVGDGKVASNINGTANGPKIETIESFKSWASKKSGYQGMKWGIHGGTESIFGDNPITSSSGSTSGSTVDTTGTSGSDGGSGLSIIGQGVKLAGEATSAIGKKFSELVGLDIFGTTASADGGIGVASGSVDENANAASGSVSDGTLVKMDIKTELPRLSVAQIRKIIEKHFNRSTVIKPSDAEGIYNAQQSTGMGALAILGIGALESGWGTSSIAKQKNNIWGWNATNVNPGSNAKSFSQMSQGALEYAQNYMRVYYEGYGAKSIYAAGTGNNPAKKGYAYHNNGQIDSSWATKVGSIMDTIYKTATDGGTGGPEYKLKTLGPYTLDDSGIASEGAGGSGFDMSPSVSSSGSISASQGYGPAARSKREGLGGSAASAKSSRSFRMNDVHRRTSNVPNVGDNASGYFDEYGVWHDLSTSGTSSDLRKVENALQLVIDQLRMINENTGNSNEYLDDISKKEFGFGNMDNKTTSAMKKSNSRRAPRGNSYNQQNINSVMRIVRPT